MSFGIRDSKLYRLINSRYFKTKNSVKNLDRIELENIETAIKWLKKIGYEKIGILGASKGAEYAAAAAIAYKELSCVILRTPSWFYSEGMIGKSPSGRSCWSYGGQELPFTPYKTRKLHVLKEFMRNKEYNILSINEGKKVVAESIIPIEKIQAPILMFSTKADTIWPSEESCMKLEERLSKNEFQYPYKHVCFEHMSHMTQMELLDEFDETIWNALVDLPTSYLGRSILTLCQNEIIIYPYKR